MTFAAVRKMALAIPGVEEGTSYGTAAFKLRGKLLVRLKEDGKTVVLITTFEDRDILMKMEPETFYITEHYRDYPCVLVRLGVVKAKQLQTLLEDAVRLVSAKAKRAR